MTTDAKKPAPLAPGDAVLTPTGRHAVIVRTDDKLHEATVRRVDDAELAHFRQSRLRRSET